MQTVIDFFYRHPKSAVQRYRRFGGYFSYRKMLRGGDEMMAASLKLPPVKSYTDGLPVYFLTGKNYLHQTLFCIQSLVRVTSEKFRFVLVDDGSFDEAIIKQIEQQLPGTKIVSNEIIEQNLGKYLPADLYPNLSYKRKVYPHIKKLTDVHTITGNDWKLVLDSDMLFWNEPAEILSWLKNPDKPIHMKDCIESYGYTTKLMEELCGNTFPALLNVGAIGLKSSTINWAQVDSWIKQLEEKEGGSYYLEQALTAMLVAGQDTIMLAPGKYIVNPPGLNRGDVLHHYVDLSKKLYYRQAWRKLAN